MADSQVLWLGIGCKCGTALPVLEAGVQQALQSQGYLETAVAGVATLDRKVQESALMQLCQSRNWPLRLFSASELAAVKVTNPSQSVAKMVGTASVAEAAALLAATPENLPHSLSDSLVEAERPQLRLSKQVFRLAGYTGAATIAIAESPPNYI
jgi:cobalamin biosynthesis protein CbiG